MNNAADTATKPTAEKLWDEFVSAWSDYEKDRSADNWIKQNRAHNEWAKAFLGAA